MSRRRRRAIEITLMLTAPLLILLVWEVLARTERIDHNPPFQFRSHSDIDAFELP